MEPSENYITMSRNSTLTMSMTSEHTRTTSVATTPTARISPTGEFSQLGLISRAHSGHWECGLRTGQIPVCRKPLQPLLLIPNYKSPALLVKKLPRIEEEDITSISQRPSWQSPSFMPKCLASAEFGTGMLQLQGWCQEKARLSLVYDYMPNGDLH